MQPIPLTETSSRRQWLMGLAALVLSVSFHGVLLRNLPDVPIGRIPDYSPGPAHQASQLKDVRLESPDRLERPDLYRLEDPRDKKPLAGTERLPSPVEKSWSPDKVQVQAPSASGFQSSADVSPLPDRQDWIPRQEIVHIEERRFADAEALLPRTLTPDFPRAMKAPDFAPPVDSIDFAKASIPNVNVMSNPDTESISANSSAGLDPGINLLPEVEMEAQFLEEAGEVLDEEAEAVSESDAVESLLELTLAAGKVSSDPYTYFELQISRSGPEGLPVLPKDVLIIQDASKSMTQRKLENCKRGILNVLNELNPEDRFNIIAFRDEIDWFFDEWQSYTGQVKERTGILLEEMKATGKTDVSGSLESIVGLRQDPGRPVIAMLVTDGRPTMGLMDSSDIIVRVSGANRGDVSVFALGGGARVNRFLLDMLSYNNRGDSLVVRQREEIPKALSAWSTQLDRPVLTDLRFRFNGLDEREIYPKTLTHLFLDRPLRIYGRTLNPENPITFRIDGMSGPVSRDMVFQIKLPEPQVQGQAIRTNWAWQKAYDLIGSHIRTNSDDLMEGIRGHAEEFSISIPYASEFNFFRF